MSRAFLSKAAGNANELRQRERVRPHFKGHERHGEDESESYSS